MRRMKIAVIATLTLFCSVYMTTNSYSQIPDASDCQVKDEDLHMAKYEILAQLVEAEAGNQGLLGRKLVADVVLNRIDSDIFPNSLEEVIFQDGQFTCIKSGLFDKAGWNVSELSYQAVKEEVQNRTNRKVLYFSRGKSPYADYHFKEEDHWFGYN